MKIITVDLPNSIINNNRNSNNLKPKIKTEPIPKQLILMNEPINLITIPDDPGREEEINDFLTPSVIIKLQKCLTKIKCKCQLIIK
mgnify:CR=1 FL=1